MIFKVAGLLKELGPAPSPSFDFIFLENLIREPSVGDVKMLVLLMAAIINVL